jgi:hypothetical protein
MTDVYRVDCYEVTVVSSLRVCAPLRRVLECAALGYIVFNYSSSGLLLINPCN